MTLHNLTYKPYTSFTGMESVQKALALVAVNPKVGGILLSGKTGVGKSELVRALEGILEEKKIIKVPLSVTEEALVGSLDMEQTLKEGSCQYKRGMLACAHNSLLFVDNINLLSKRIVNKLLQIKESGFFFSPEGKKLQCNFSIIATMNPDEGAITTRLLDSFGLFVEIPEQIALENRIEILKEQERWETNPQSHRELYGVEESSWKERLQKATDLLPQVEIKDTDLQAIAKLCQEAFVAGHRGDLALLWAAKTYAALEGRKNVLMNDILIVKDWALAHRIRNPKQAPPQSSEQSSPPKENNSDVSQGKNNKEKQLSGKDKEENVESNSLPETLANDDTSAQEDNPQEERFDVADLQIQTNILQEQSKLSEKREGIGKRIKCRDLEGKGRHVRAQKIRNQEIEDIDFVATLRAAAPFQKLRNQGDLAVCIHREDLHRKVREHRIGNTILFLVDASGSMGVKRRMEEAKAGVFSLLKDAYVHRDSVALMTFRKEKSELLLPPTRSISRAYELLREVKTGGRTPLFHGLESAMELLKNLKMKDKNRVPSLVIFTDGKATSSYKGENSLERIQQIAQKYAELQLKTFLIDTECGFIRLRYARQLANWMNASYFELDDLKQINLKEFIYK